MAASGQKLLDKLQKFREGELKDEQGAKEKLEEIHKFLTDHETVSPSDCTHEVLNGFGDWWVSQKSTKRLGIAEDNTVDALYKHMATMYEMGVPLTLGEKRTPQFKLLQDIEIRGTKDDYVKPEELIGDQKKFLHILGKHMKELFPSLPDIHVMIFDGSGTSSLLGVLQTTVRVVWPQIIVDKDRAGTIMDYMAHKLSSSEDEDIKALETRMKGLSDSNSWKSMFADSIYFGSVAIRMPLNDSVAQPPMMRPERRAFKPLNIFSFQNSSDSQMQEIQVLYDHTKGGDSFESREFIKMGCTRMPTGTPLTDWVRPTWTGESRPPPGRERPSAVSSGVAPSRTGRNVHVRTTAGSDAPNKPRGPGTGGRPQLETKKDVERQFLGSLEEFKTHLEASLKEEGVIEVDEKERKIKWSQRAEVGAFIVFREDNHRVYFHGKEHQVRSLLTVCGNFVQTVSEAAGSTNGRTSVAGTGYAGSQLPSQAFAPRGAGSVAGRTKPTSLAAVSASRSVRSSAGNAGQASASSNQVPYQRIVTVEFEADAEGELTLSIGDTVTVEKDDPEDGDGMDRWVYGLNPLADKRGWFPLSYTKSCASAGGLEAVSE